MGRVYQTGFAHRFGFEFANSLMITIVTTSAFGNNSARFEGSEKIGNYPGIVRYGKAVGLHNYLVYKHEDVRINPKVE